MSAVGRTPRDPHTNRKAPRRWETRDYVVQQMGNNVYVRHVRENEDTLSMCAFSAGFAEAGAESLVRLIRRLENGK